MSFLQREYDRLHKICTEHDTETEVHKLAYMAKQAIAWAMEPDGVASPSALMHKWHGIIDEGTKGTGVHWTGKIEKSPEHNPPH